jgi:hypothetical protein
MTYSRDSQHFPQLRHRVSRTSFAMRSGIVAVGAGDRIMRRRCTSLRQAFLPSPGVIYSDSLNATAIACLNQARAWFMACRTARSSDRGLNLSTFSEAACNASAWSTSARNRSRSFRLMDLQWAVTSATMSINAALGSGNSGRGSNSGTAQRGRPNLNTTCTRVVTAAVIPSHWNYSHPYVGEPT